MWWKSGTNTFSAGSYFTIYKANKQGASYPLYDEIIAQDGEVQFQATAIIK